MNPRQSKKKDTSNRHASTRTSYSEKLKDPRWQKMRLKVLERDGWICKLCLSSSNTLNVHHKAYRKNCEPWEYASDILISLCEDCHEEEHSWWDICEISIDRAKAVFTRKILNQILTTLSDIMVSGHHEMHTDEKYFLKEIKQRLCPGESIEKILFLIEGIKQDALEEFEEHTKKKDNK